MLCQVDAPGNTGVFGFKPHVDKIASMQYAPANPALLYSASHDGTIRCLDIQKQIFDLVVATGDDFTDSGFTCASISPVDVNSIYLSGKMAPLPHCLPSLDYLLWEWS